MPTIYTRMAADAATYWSQAQDWLGVISGLLEQPARVDLDSSELQDLRNLCSDTLRADAPTDEHAERLRRLSKSINPSPSPATIAMVGGPHYPAIIDEIVGQHGGRAEVLALRRAALSYYYSSLILDGLQQRRRAIAQITRRTERPLSSRESAPGAS